MLAIMEAEMLLRISRIAEKAPQRKEVRKDETDGGLVDDGRWTMDRRPVTEALGSPSRLSYDSVR